MISSYAIHNWLTITIVLLISLLTLLHFLYESRFLKFISLTKNNEYFIDYIQKKASFMSLFNGLLFFFQLSIYALFIYYSLFVFEIITNDYYIYLQIFSYLFVFIIGRYLIGLLLSFVFGIAKIQGVLSFVKFTYIAKVAVYILPFVIVTCFYPTNKRLFTSITLSFTLLFLLYFYIRLLVQNQKIIFRNLLYFILYLCTLEIIPLIYLYRTIGVDW